MNVNLNTRCEIQYKVVTQDANYGTEVITWTLLAAVWCEKQDLLPSRSESVQNGVAVSTGRSRIRMRFREDIDTSMRCIIKDITYQIVAEPAELGRREHIEFVIEKHSS